MTTLWCACEIEQNCSITFGTGLSFYKKKIGQSLEENMVGTIIRAFFFLICKPDAGNFKHQILQQCEDWPTEYIFALFVRGNYYERNYLYQTEI